MKAFALSVLTPCIPFLLSRFTDWIVSCFLAWKRKLIFHITCREFTYFHLLKTKKDLFRSAGFLTLSIYYFISNMKTQFRKNISFTYCHLSCNATKPTKWPVCPAKTRIRLGNHTVWSEPSLSAWRTLAQADLSLRWAHRLVCWFCHVAAHLCALYVCGPVRMGCGLRVG